MRLMFWTAAFWAALGLAAGLFYREYTVMHDFTGQYTELSVVHTHTLVLGMLAFLLLMGLERLFTLTASRKLFIAFYWFYNIGLLVTVAMMVVIGSRTILGKSSNPALDGIAGLGHMLLTAALALLFACLGTRVLPRRHHTISEAATSDTTDQT